jgi:DNA polymerase III subunit delta
MNAHPPATLITGNSPALLSRAVEKALGAIDTEVDAIIDTSGTKDLATDLAQSDLFATDQHFIVRDPTPAQVKDLVAYLSAPMQEANHVIIVHPKAPAALKKAVQSAGGVIQEIVGKNSQETIRKILEESPVSLDMRAKNFFIEHIGDNLSDVPSILDDLLVFYGPGHNVSYDEITPFLGAKGSVPIWGLLDAIDASDPVKALTLLDRMWSSNTPASLTSIITNHLEKIFRLSTAGITDEQEAAAFLGLKGSTYPAKKAIQVGRRYKSAIGPMVLLAQQGAHAVRGGSGVPVRLTVEILIGRLCTYPRK